jgi:sugar lactone lactonase YvrE
VTELILKLHPKSILNTPDGTYWSGMVVFTPDQAEQLAIKIEEPKMTKKMFGGLVMACMPPLMMVGESRSS